MDNASGRVFIINLISYYTSANVLLQRDRICVQSLGWPTQSRPTWPQKLWYHTLDKDFNSIWPTDIQKPRSKLKQNRTDCRMLGLANSVMALFFGRCMGQFTRWTNDAVFATSKNDFTALAIFLNAKLWLTRNHGRSTDQFDQLSFGGMRQCTLWTVIY